MVILLFLDFGEEDKTGSAPDYIGEQFIHRPTYSLLALLYFEGRLSSHSVGTLLAFGVGIPISPEKIP